MRQTRREFVKGMGIGLGAMLVPTGFGRVARAMTAAGDRTLVVLFLRGGADGINLVVPRGDETNYIALRRNDETGQDITLPPAPPELQLDGFFEAHPGLGPLVSRYDDRELAFLHAVGGTGNYSHFTAQDAMERAEPVNPSFIADGWMHRALGVLRDSGDLNAPVLSLSGVSLGSHLAKSLAGPDVSLTMAFPSISDFRLTGDFADEAGKVLRSIYEREAGPLLSGPSSAVFGALDALAGVGSQPPDANYPNNAGLNRAFQDVARLIKNPELGVKMISVDYGGWDHHSNELNRMNSVASALSGTLDAFWTDIGAAANRTCLLVVTEFGRTAFVNGNGGTDHGWATTMLAMGGGISGGRVLTRGDPDSPGTGRPTPSGHWPGLGPGELHVQPGSGQERDLKATTDFRDVFGEVLQRFMRLPPDAVRDDVLLGYAPRWPGLFRPRPQRWLEPAPRPRLIDSVRRTVE
jgi:uncharacterized protein (DUF1501 family)